MTLPVVGEPTSRHDDDMSTTGHDDRRTHAQTDTDTVTPPTHQLAAELGVDARLMCDFVDNHHRPTPAAILGWASAHGDLRAPPEQLRPDVEAWLDERERRSRAGRSDEPVDVEDTALGDHQILAMWGVETDE